MWLAQQGYYGQKWALPGFGREEEPQADQARLLRLREAAGPHARIMVDALGQWSADYAARMMPLLGELGIAWIEEPLA